MYANRIILGCTIALACIYLYSTTKIPSLEIGDPLGPKAFPYLLGIALLAAAGMLGFEMWRDSRKESPEETSGPLFEPRVVVVLIGVSIWTGLYYFAFDDLGYVISTAVYLLPLMAFFHPGKWIANIATALLFAGLTYYLFIKLEVNLPKGVLPF